MDLPNPYVPGIGYRPAPLFGREEIVRRAVELFAQLEEGYGAQWPVYVGERGMGKSALLGEVEEHAGDRGWRVVHVEGQTETALVAALFARLGQILHDVERSRLREFLDRWGFDATLGLRAPFVSAEVSARRLAEPERVMLDDLVQRTAEAAGAAGGGLVVVVDEIQRADGASLQALGSAVHACNQRRLPATVFGAGLPSAKTHVRDNMSYGERTEFIDVRALDREASGLALSHPAERLGVQWSEPAWRAVLDDCGGYPYLLQLEGHATWRQVPDGARRIEEPHAGRGIAVGRDKMVELYERRWMGAAPQERVYLAAMAATGGGSRTGADPISVHALLGVSASDVSSYRARLVEKGHIYVNDTRRLHFSLPGLDRYVVDHADELPPGRRAERVQEALGGRHVDPDPGSPPPPVPER